MDLGTAPLFDLTAPAAEAGEHAVVSRSQELLASIQQRRSVITDQEIATVREVAEWAGEHIVDDEAAAATLIDRGLDTDLDTGLDLERLQFAGLFATQDRATGMASFLESGPGKAVFEGR